MGVYKYPEDLVAGLHFLVGNVLWEDLPCGGSSKCIVPGYARRYDASGLNL